MIDLAPVPAPTRLPAPARLLVCAGILTALFAFPLGISSLTAQTTNNPFPNPIETEDGVVVVDVIEFASIPDSDGKAARMMNLVDEPGTGRLFVNDMRGLLHTVSYDGTQVQLYLDLDDPRWGVGVEAGGRERGFQSFALHPDFGREGEPGYGRLYTWTDVQDTSPAADFRPGGGDSSHHTVLHEWVAQDPTAPTYDGGAPRELMRFEQPFGNHNAGHVAFHPSEPEDAEYGLLYIGSADGGSGGDPLNLSQDLSSGFGKILRIDPLGSNSANGQYGIPSDNPWADGAGGALPELYAIGMRNPQRFGWDPANGNLFMADIGQNIVEKVSSVPKGGNLGWNEWEGSFRFLSRGEVSLENPRSDPAVTYPVVEYGRYDPLMHDRAAATGVHVYRSFAIPQLRNRVIFGDLVSGEILHFDADDLPEGGTEGIRRILLRHVGVRHTFLELVQAKNREQGRPPASRTDLRFGSGPNDQIFLLNKHDGTIRLLVGGP
ncbi:MAG: PQQ-dependent sugar dehydrogenase [Gemmatimonadota bacterium]